MTKTMISARIPKKLDERLEAIASSERRSKSFVVEEALQLYSEREEWMIARAEASQRQAEEKGEWYSHEAVMDYFNSLGTAHPKPRPKADILRAKTKQ